MEEAPVALPPFPCIVDLLVFTASIQYVRRTWLHSGERELSLSLRLGKLEGVDSTPEGMNRT